MVDEYLGPRAFIPSTVLLTKTLVPSICYAYKIDLLIRWTLFPQQTKDVSVNASVCIYFLAQLKNEHAMINL